MRRVPVLLPLLSLALAAPATASDGVHEINQACAVSTGCFPGDAPGFPVQLTASGSYVLTSDLDVTPSTQGIREDANGLVVTLDLNGFSIRGGGTGTSSGVALVRDGRWEVRNGTISGFPNGGVVDLGPERGHRVFDVRFVDNEIAVQIFGEGARVEGCHAESRSTNLVLGPSATVVGNTVLGTLHTAGANTGGIGVGDRSIVSDNVVTGNAATGISAGNDSTVTGNTIGGNGTHGLVALSGSGYGGNVINGNPGGAVLGGARQIGTNVCDGNTTCP